jgi:IclR family acetate operon transcriptional repressor
MRSLRLLDALAASAGRGSPAVGVVGLARDTGLSAATAHRLLATLGQEGYVAQDPESSQYRLGSRLFALAATAESPLSMLRERVARPMEELRGRFGETVNLSVLDRRHIVYVHQVECDRPLRAFNRTGNRVLAHATAAGKALLAHEPDTLLRDLFAGVKLEALTASTITSTDILTAALDAVRVSGYALDLGEQDEDIVCVAAPILSAGCRPAGALSISGPEARMRRLDLDETGGELARAAAEPLARG